MTEKEYEGTPELIFYCEYNPNDFEDRLEIPFTNEYDIKLDFSRDEETKEICINVDLQTKESNVPKGFFGKNILNVTAIAGKNGVGKTNALRRITTNAKALDFESIKLYLIQNKIFVDSSKNIELVFNMGLYNVIGVKSLIIANISSLFPNTINYGVLRKISATNTAEGLYAVLCDYQQNVNNIFNITKISRITLDIPNLVEILQYDFLEPYKKQLEKIGMYIEEHVHFSNINGKEIFLLCAILKFLNYRKDVYPHEIFQNELQDIFREDCTVESIAHEVFSSQAIDLDVDFFDENVYNQRLWSQREQEHLQVLYDLFYKVDKNRFLYNGYDLQLNISDPIGNELEIFLAVLSRLNLSKREIDVLSNIFVLDFGSYSAGEWFLLESFAFLEDVLSEKTMSLDDITSIILCLDEYEQSLHPEWSRKYLSYLLKFLDTEGERLGIKFQVVLTTHSPYLISDLPKENIILLEKDEKTGKRTARKSNYGFASNYYDIMSDSFFLDDTIGEFAKQKINSCIQAINHISDDLDKLANDELILHDGLSLFIEESLETIEEQNKIIDLVGDKFIQKQLQQLSDSVKQRLLVHSDDSVRKQQLEQDIAELEERIRQKKMELNND